MQKSKKMPLRIALFGIYHESNTFTEKLTTLDDFRQSHWLQGEDILEEYRHSFHEIGGMIEALEKQDVELVPLTFAEATPGGIITAEAYDVLLRQVTEALTDVLPVDGCLMALHGAAVSQGQRDMDGHWLGLIRKLVGPDVPLVGTIDPHANVSHAMIAATDALIAYKTNPHIDQKETGRVAADLLVKTLNGEVSPKQHLCLSPVAISIEQQHTESEPCKSLYAFCNELVRKEDLLHLSINLGFPYADVEEMGTSFIVLTDGELARTAAVCRQLKEYMKVYKNEFVGKRRNIAALLPLLGSCDKPILLLDMGDNIGGGAPGNSLYLLEALEKAGSLKTFFCLYAPEAVSIIINSNAEAVLTLRLRDDQGNQVLVSARVFSIVDGKFSERTPRHGGQVSYDMGTTAIVETTNGHTLMLMSNRVPPFSLQQLTAFGVSPADFDVIVAKGVIAPIAAYAPVCKTVFQVDTPGVTQANMTSFIYKNRRKPLFPFESIAE